ncbi:uncharacterized protein RCC_12202 [Ramularia collo-cygni]|uniref:Uncharacterized protein n=1 Tax=Ramularia collo-cygni TaxID=112498 RepID=A0A2D3UQ95_9PEZI|nr:uncharacterized protein RCC_12202 [Ramularia collo-cygni]CZT17831.1 uncharacterized protein RCC_12202 [Ramularia collo-cygni]
MHKSKPSRYHSVSCSICHLHCFQQHPDTIHDDCYSKQRCNSWNRLCCGSNRLCHHDKPWRLSSSNCDYYLRCRWSFRHDYRAGSHRDFGSTHCM